MYKKRFYPERGGSSCCNITIKDDELVNMCFAILKDIGWIGFADFDVIEDESDGLKKVLEINPRLPACIKSAFDSGIDYATLIARQSLGLPIRRYEYKPGCTLRYIGFELLWFISSNKRFNLSQHWFQFFGKNIYFQDLQVDDIRPFFFGSLGNFIKLLRPSFREAKSHIR
jgi:predicted ATP-grasp superfamily ATP-dependent carboligase